MPPREFHVQPQRNAVQETSAQSAGAGVDAGADAALEAAEGRSLPAGTASAVIDGIPFEVPGYTILAFVEVDLEGDADKDAIVALTNGAESATGLAKREAAGFSRTIMRRNPLPEGCSIEGSNLVAVPTQLSIITNRLRCVEGPRVSFEIVYLGGAPRPAFAVDLIPPAADDPFLSSLMVSPRIADGNSDGVNDIVFDVETRDRFGGARRKESFTVAQGITGFATNLSSVVTRLKAIARSSTRDLNRQAARAARDAAHGLALARALCPEAGSPRITMRENGAGCGEEGSPGAFTGTLAVALAKTSKFDDLARLLDLIDASAGQLDDASRTALGTALRGARARIAPAYQTVPLPPEISPSSVFGFTADGSLATSGSVTGVFARSAPFAFSPSESVTLVSPPSARRIGAQLFVRRGTQAKIVGIPELDGATVRECVVDSQVRSILCTTEAGPMLAPIGGSP